MVYTLDSTTLANLLRDAAALGANAALTATGVLTPYMSQNAAWKKYGRANVERWVEQGLVYPIKDGGESGTAKVIRMDRLELEASAKTANKPYYRRSIEIK